MITDPPTTKFTTLSKKMLDTTLKNDKMTHGRGGGVKLIFKKISSLALLEFFHKGSQSQLLYLLINDEGVCKRVPATHGLLKKSKTQSLE